VAHLRPAVPTFDRVVPLDAEIPAAGPAPGHRLAPVDESVVAHYNLGVEADRLAGPSLERLRTEALLRPHLPATPADVADVGGGPGRYAAWLAGLGHRVTLIDPVPLHVEQASAAAAGRWTSRVGDARALDLADASFDVVLLLGPLYHLPEAPDRARALAEGARVLRPGGVLAAAGISRLASLLDGMASGFASDAAFRAMAEEDLRSGRHRNPDGRPEWFTTAYFHRPDDLAGELRDAGLVDVVVHGVEGPGWLFPALVESRPDVARWAAEAAQLEPLAQALSAHFLAIGRRP
jgi:SAM-dependent methyltransferase